MSSFLSRINAGDIILIVLFGGAIGGIVSHYAFKAFARSLGKVPKAIQIDAEKVIQRILPSTIWTPIYLRVENSPEIVIRWNSHFLVVSTTALSELTFEELSFLVQSERRQLKIFREKYLYGISLLVVIPCLVACFVIIYAKLSTYIFIPLYALEFVSILLLAHWARQHADKWRKLADEQTVAESSHPHATVTAVQKSIGSALPESKQTPYQISMKRLEVVEEAIRRRENQLNNRFL